MRSRLGLLFFTLSLSLHACGDDESADGGDDGNDGTGDDGNGTDGTGDDGTGDDGDGTDDGNDGTGDDGDTTDDGGTTGTGDLPEPTAYLPIFLEGGREGIPYAVTIPLDATGYQLLSGSLPAGLQLDPGGEISGTPTEPDIHEFSLVVDFEGEVTELGVQLAIFSDDDSETTTTEAMSERGPYWYASTFLEIPSITVSTGTYPDVAVLVTYPADQIDDPIPSDGVFPVIAFHHAAHSPPDIFDDYGALHEHWASWGYIVASVDSTMNLTPPGVGFLPQSWTNLSDMSTFQRAAVDIMLDANADPGSPFFEHVDERRLVVSGHSRGGAASMISLHVDPRLFGGIMFEPVSPIQTPGQSYDDPNGHFDVLLPRRPILIFSATNDRDEPWPLPAVSYEQHTGPMAFVAIHGTNHEWTYDEDTPGSTTSDSQITAAQRHDIDQHYSTAFLGRFTAAEARYEDTVFGPGGRSTNLSPLGVSVHGDRYMSTTLMVDDFASADPTTNLLGAANSGSGLGTNDNVAVYDEGLTTMGITGERRTRINARGRARELSWAQAGAQLDLDLGGSVDATDHRYLLVRGARTCPPPPGFSGPDNTCPPQTLAFEVAVRDGSGASYSWSTGAGIAGDNGIVGRHWAGVIAELAEADASVDLDDLAAVEVRLLGNGSVWLDDVRLE